MTAWRLACAAAAGLGLGCAAAAPPATPAVLSADARVELAGQFSIPPLTDIPAGSGVAFGGLSGIAPAGAPGEYLAVSDDRARHRVYRLRVGGEGEAFRVDVLGSIALDEMPPAPRLDPEGIVVSRAGDLLLASEGRPGQDPPVPPAIAQFTAGGRFVRELAIRERFTPAAPGAAARGVRGNAGFESLTLAPGGRRLFSATETALYQDGAPVGFDRGTTARLLEYVAGGGTFAPAREFAYPLDAMEPVAFTVGATASGIVELLALSDDELLALERTYVEAAGEGRGINRIRLYRVSTAGADDVSAVDSLKGRQDIRPVRKTLLSDLASLAGLAPELGTLENFEGLAFGPRLADGSPSLILVSDDNFNRTQRTWFVLLRLVRQVHR